MKQFMRVCLLLIIMAVTSVAVYTPTPVAAYEPTEGVLFNDTNSTLTADKYKLVNHIHTAIDNAPTGSTIRIVTFHFTLDGSVSAMKRAASRGVNVKVIVGGVQDSPQIAELQRILGTDMSKGSYAIRCLNACTSATPDDGSLMHSKFMTFSKTGTANNVSMITSSNLTKGQVTMGTNDIYTVNENPELYSKLNTYFDKLRTREVYSGPTIIQPIKRHDLYIFPGIDPANDPFMNMLNSVDCSRTPSVGYGTNGKTVIEIIMFAWLTDRADIARKLNTMSQSGCIVRVILTSHESGPVVIERLLENGSEVRLRNGARDVNGDGVFDGQDTYIHSKLIMVNGVYAGDTSKKFVFTGSTNFTKTGQNQNDNLSILIHREGIYDSYKTNFNRIFTAATPITLP